MALFKRILLPHHLFVTRLELWGHLLLHTPLNILLFPHVLLRCQAISLHVNAMHRRHSRRGTGGQRRCRDKSKQQRQHLPPNKIN